MEPPLNPGPRLLLASASPRRRDLLQAAGYRFEVCPAPVNESAASFLTAVECVRLNARLKARAGLPPSPGCPPTLVLAADTLVNLGSEALGKPRDMVEAFGMLSRLSGRTHEVFTGVCLWPTDGSRIVEFVERTAVTFRALDAPAIRAYLARINPLDKAGAYAAQEHGRDIIAAVDGSWTNVLGLPMETLGKLLALRGLRPFCPHAPPGTA